MSIVLREERASYKSPYQCIPNEFHWGQAPGTVVTFEQFLFFRWSNIVPADKETIANATNRPSRCDSHEGLARN